MSAYVPGRSMTAIAMPPRAGPTMDPVWLTLLENETPRTAWDRGMTCASKADRAGRSKPPAMPVTKITARMPRRPSEPVAESAAKTTAQSGRDRARHEHDRAAVPPVGQVAPEEHEREGRDRLDQAEPAERQRVAGDLVGLERDGRRERAAGEVARQARAEERPELGLAEEWTLDVHGEGEFRRGGLPEIGPPKPRGGAGRSRR